MNTYISIIIAALCFLAITQYLFIDLTGFGVRKAIRELPYVAEKFGFLPREKKSSHNFSIYEGEYRGYSFFIDPDQGAKIAMEMAEIKGLEQLSSAKGITVFDFPHVPLNKCFKTRNVTSESQNEFKKAMTFQNVALSFYKKWHRKSEYITISSDYFQCSLKYGQASYIPASILAEIIPDMVELANAMQHDLNPKH